MFDIERWKEIWFVLTQNKVRTILTAFGVFWGILMLVLMMGSGNGLRNGVKSEFGNFATNSLFVWAQTTSKPYKGYKPGRYPQLTNEDAEAIRRNVPEIEYFAPRNQLGGYREGNNVTRKNKAGTFTVTGDYPEYFKIDKKKLKYGRLINHIDIKENRKVCVIGPRVREILFEPDENPLGEWIKIQGVYFQVVGEIIVEGGMMSRRDQDAIYTPFTTFQNAFNYGNKISWFAMTAKPQYDAAEVEKKVKDILKERHKVAPDDNMAFGSFNAGREFERMNSAFTVIDWIVWIVGVFTLIAGIVGISNIMIVVVKERTKEFGIRRAIGATPKDIVTQIVLESIVLTLIAGYVGLVAGVYILETVSYAIETFGGDAKFFKNPQIDFKAAVKALILLTISGAFAGFLPAARAVKIKPIEALREE
jgi:putative ABC transport system permease protein